MKNVVFRQGGYRETSKNAPLDLVWAWVSFLLLLFFVVADTALRI